MIDLERIEALVTERGSHKNTDEWVLNLVALADCVPQLLAELRIQQAGDTLDVRPGRILVHVAEDWDVSIVDLTGPSRAVPLVHARHVAMYLLRRHTELSLPAVGKLVNREHTTVLGGVRKVEGRPDLLARAKRVSERLRAATAASKQLAEADTPSLHPPPAAPE